MRPLPAFAGIVLAGGRSTRMGTDKAFLVLDGATEPLACVSLRALEGAGAVAVLSIGGDRARLADLGFDARADDDPDEGPLGGLITGLDRTPAPILVVLTCDLPAIDAATVRVLVAALDDHPEAAAAIPVVDGRRQIITAAYRRTAHEPLTRAFADGERSVRRAVAGLAVVELDGLDPAVFHDLDRPEDLAKYASSDPPSVRGSGSLPDGPDRPDRPNRPNRPDPA